MRFILREPDRTSRLLPPCIQAIGAILAAAVTGAGGIWTNLLTYTGPGADPQIPATVTLPPSTVTVTVTVPAPAETSPTEQPGLVADSVSLTELEPLEGGVCTGPQRVNTHPYSDTVYQYSGCGEKSSATYQLDRSYDLFEATVGPSDDSRSGYIAFFTVTVDGREVLKEQVSVGESRMIRAIVSGGYRMSISIIGERADGGCYTQGLKAVWAEPRLTSGT